jgi:hypothetical protein
VNAPIAAAAPVPPDIGRAGVRAQLERRLASSNLVNSAQLCRFVRDVAQAIVRAIYDWDWLDAERSLRRAVQLNSNLSPAQYSLSKALFTLGHAGAGLAEIRRAQDLDPPSVMVIASRALATKPCAFTSCCGACTWSNPA